MCYARMRRAEELLCQESGCSHRDSTTVCYLSKRRVEAAIVGENATCRADGDLPPPLAHLAVRPLVVAAWPRSSRARR